jgi:CDP-diacylglycerol--glycerol-3-phosphate 3-phosphatidyltransferase
MLKGSVLEAAFYRFLGRYLVPCCLFLRLKANHVSFFSLLCGLGAGISFVFNPFWGGLLTLITGFLDSVLDRYAEFFILLGIWAYFLRRGHATPLITITVFLVLFGSVMVSYTKARAEGLMVSCFVGLFQRGERIIAIGVAGMVNSLINFTARANETALLGQDAVLIVTFIFLAVGTNLTALWRLFHVLNKLRD